jgi:NADPH-dependent 2,4-dienoyl-CoA reductase/sulfur reductase-like enzyme
VQNDVETDLVFRGAVLGADTFPPDLAARYEQLFADAGVHLIANRRADTVRADDAAVVLVLDDGTELERDAVVLGLGVSPVADLAVAAGLEVDDDGGGVVDERLRTSDAAI